MPVTRWIAGSLLLMFGAGCGDVAVSGGYGHDRAVVAGYREYPDYYNDGPYVAGGWYDGRYYERDEWRHHPDWHTDLRGHDWNHPRDWHPDRSVHVERSVSVDRSVHVEHRVEHPDGDHRDHDDHGDHRDR